MQALLGETAFRGMLKGWDDQGDHEKGSEERIPALNMILMMIKRARTKEPNGVWDNESLDRDPEATEEHEKKKSSHEHSGNRSQTKAREIAHGGRWQKTQQARREKGHGTRQIPPRDREMNQRST